MACLACLPHTQPHMVKSRYALRQLLAFILARIVQFATPKIGVTSMVNFNTSIDASLPSYGFMAS